MTFKSSLKQRLLRHGGYRLAQGVYFGIERYKIIHSMKTFLNTGKLPLPGKVIFEPTLRCNLRCSMCYQDRPVLRSLKELMPEQITDFFDRTPYLKKVSLIGGEIFVRGDIINVIRHLASDRDIIISTNGTLLGETEIAELKTFPRIFTICISLDGPKEIHESIRQIRGSYERSIRTIKGLAPLVPVTVNCVIQSENLDVLPDFVAFCAGFGVRKLKLELERLYSKETIQETRDKTGLKYDDIPIVPNSSARRYTLQSLQRTLRECQRRGRRKGIYVMFDPSFLMERLEACYEGNLRKNQKYLCRNFGTATIAPNGDLINCRKIRKSFGNILDAPFEDIWNSEAARNYRRQLLHNNLTAVCENCPSLIPNSGD
jgi:MoaA/NifB/PqqE/SkfB family radical SAM enzyme